MDTTTLMVGLIAGCFGIAYFRYGKKQDRMVMMISGIALCIYPYFVENNILLVLIGAALIALPFFIKE